MVVDVGGEDDFVRFGALHERFELLARLVRVADRRAGGDLAEQMAFGSAERRFEVRLGRRQRTGRAGAQLEERLLGGGAQQLGLLFGIGCKHVEAHHDIGCVQLRGSHEVLPVGGQRFVKRGGCKVRSEGVGQPQQGRQLGAVEAGSQNPQRHPQPLSGHRVHLPFGTGFGKVVPQFHHVPGKLVDVPNQGPPQCMGGDLIGARRPADA